MNSVATRTSDRIARKRLIQATGASLLIHALILLIPMKEPIVAQQSEPFPALSLQFAAADTKPAATTSAEPTAPSHTEPQVAAPAPTPQPVQEPIATDTSPSDDTSPIADNDEAVDQRAAALPVREQTAPLDEYQLKLYQEIQNARSYPRSALARRQEGAVSLQFTLSRDGTLLGMPVVESPSRYGVLNRAAVQAVLDAAPFPPFPDSLSRSNLEISVTIRFSLS